jgi:hypothetical protein
MNDADRKLLDGSILEPMPPFPSVGDVIAGERRRQRLRRAAAVVAAAATIAGVVFAVQAGMRGSPTTGPTVGPGQSSGAGTSTPPPRTVETTENRLTQTVLARLSTVVPGSTSTVEPSTFAQSDPALAGFATNLAVATPRGTGTVTLLALWPAPDHPSPSDDGLTVRFGCVELFAELTPPANQADQSCEERTDVNGLHLALGVRSDAGTVTYTVVAFQPDGAIVRLTATNDPGSGMDTPVLSLSQLREIVSDPSMAP